MSTLRDSLCSGALERWRIPDRLRKLLVGRYFPLFRWSWKFWWTKRMSKYEFFTDKESRGLKDELMQRLVKARRLTDAVFVITSGLRLPSENESLPGAVSNSSHLAGLGVDIRTTDSTSMFKIVKALLEAGFTRIGLYVKDRHIHVDCDSTKPQNVIWIVN